MALQQLQIYKNIITHSLQPRQTTEVTRLKCFTFSESDLSPQRVLSVSVDTLSVQTFKNRLKAFLLTQSYT